MTYMTLYVHVYVHTFEINFVTNLNVRKMDNIARIRCVSVNVSECVQLFTCSWALYYTHPLGQYTRTSQEIRTHL